LNLLSVYQWIFFLPFFYVKIINKKYILSFIFQFAALGAFLLVVGFLAFNGASQLTITHPRDNEIIALAITNTIISGNMSGFSTLVLRR
jgi:ammonia channel protein AmtB